LQDRIHFAGFRDDIPALLQASDAFCLPSLSEGLPYALLEAGSYRLPLLVTRVGGMAELLTHKQTAFLAPPADPLALAEGLRWLIDHPQETSVLGQAAFDLIRQRFNPEKMIAQTLAVYEHMAVPERGT
jgi:glycosyltransferase involved in cell wall biosynthesis